MTKNYLLGLDLGSGSVRALLVEAQTGEVTSATHAWRHPPAPEAGNLAFNFDTAGAWRALGETVRQALQKAGIKGQDVAGVAVTSFRHGTIVMDHRGEILLSASNRDARAAEQGMALAATRGDEFYALTGRTPSPVFLAARLLWLKENGPQAFESAYAALSISDWAGYMLTGQVAADLSQAGESLLLDLKTRRWSTEILESLGLPERLLPELREAGTSLGRLTPEAAGALGLPAGIPVAVGGADTQCGLLGMGVASAGQMGVVAGTTTPVQLAVGEPILDPKMCLWTGLHVVPGLYVLESNAGQMGSSLEWFARLLYPQAPNPAAALCAEAEASGPGAHGIFSTIGAMVFNASAMSMPVDTLTYTSVNVRPAEEARADIARAILEGMACAVRANVEQVAAVGGMPERVWLGGGISRSALWTQIVSDVLGYPVLVSASSEATALGAAICAGVGAGLFADLETGAQKLARVSRRHQPGAESPTYQSLYADWQSLRQERCRADEAAAGVFTNLMLTTPATAESSATATAFRPRIYISAEVDDVALQRLSAIGQVTYKPYRSEGILLTGDDLAQTLQGYHVFVTEVDIVDAEVLLKLPDLRLIAVCRGNPVNIDIEACTLAGVAVVNTPARNADAVADLAVAFMLMLARKLQPAAAFLRQPGGEAGDLGRMGQAHEEFLGVELWRKTVGLVGGGAIGRKVVARLLPFGARVLVYDPFLSEEQVACLGAEKVSLERLLAESDLVSLHAPVTDDTRGLIDAEALARMKPGAFLVNTARAALVDESALLEALRSGKLGGYATDVFPVEPPGADDPLLAFPNVIATPHIGGNTCEVAAHQGEIIVDELSLLLAGRRPRHLLNPAVMESFRWSGARQMDEARLRQRSAGPGPGVTDLDVAAQQKAAAIRTDSLPAAAPQAAAPTDEVQKMDTTDTRQKMIAILEEFTARVAADQEMVSFARGKNVVFLFTVKDLDQSFYLSFVNGQVSASLDAPPREPDVKLKMAADILDGMFTGRVNATKAATSGKLSFSGDTGKAMAFIRIQGHMSRLYSEARAKIGDPGDLTRLGAAPAPSVTPAPAPAAAPAPARTAVPPAYAVPAAPKTGDVRDQLLMVTNELYAKGLITATGGNVSARCDDNPNEIWITPSAIFKGDLRADMMVRIDLDGHILSETDYSASSERRVHCAIYRDMPEVTAVIHSHAEYATLMALTRTKFQPISADAAFFGDIPVVPFIMPGTDELAEAVAKAMRTNGIAVLMQNHGLVVAGSSLRRAADMTEIIEETARKLITCRLLGVKPVLLPKEAVRTLKEIGASMA